MESNKFDALARRAVGEDSSRRGVLRAGIGALAASALAVIGLSAVDDAAANDKAKKRRRQHQRDKATRRRHRITVICYRGETLEVRDKKVNQKFPGHTQGACVCQEPTPLTCGLGCCSTAFPVCCPNPSFGSDPGQSAGSVCAPITSACCPANQGGGACDAPTPTCCPPTNRNTRGFCAEAGAACCGNAVGPNGALACSFPYTKCCPQTATNQAPGCCRPNEVCCGRDADCPAGLVCSFSNFQESGGGCCRATVLTQSEGRSRAATAEKVGVSAK